MRKFLPLLPLLLASACTLGPDYHTPAPPPPSTTGAFQSSAPGISSAAPGDQWWHLYDDPVLDRLVEKALAANTDLRAARANLTRARAVLQEAQTLRLPGGGITGSADYGNNEGSAQLAPGKNQWSFSSVLTLQWEIDLFGRITRTIEAAHADADAVEATRDRVALTVAAETTRAYVNACALAESTAIARDSIGIAERELTIQQARERAGSASRLDTERSATTLANIRSTLPTLEGRRRVALFELGALIGVTPSEIPQEAWACAHPPVPVQAIPVGDGQSLLARRPDVREAERRLAGDTARIGVATADLYPRIAIGGSGNFFRNNEVRGGNSWTFSVGPMISWDFPNIPAARTRIRQAEASTQASLAAFDGAVLTALKEVEQALSVYAAEQESNGRLNESVTHADAAYRLADQRYKAGSIAFLDLLDAQRTLLVARAALATSNEQLSSDRVDLFKALGGGWQTKQTAAR
jgi:NodT family efflux transporter outer membrane factor (OMF) lipoprotein